MIFLASIIIVLITAFVLWVLLAPVYKKIGSIINNKLKYFIQEEKKSE